MIEVGNYTLDKVEYENRKSFRMNMRNALVAPAYNRVISFFIAVWGVVLKE